MRTYLYAHHAQAVDEDDLVEVEGSGRGPAARECELGRVVEAECFCVGLVGGVGQDVVVARPCR